MSDFIGRIQKKDVQVGVVGLGYVGLPLAMEFASAGLRTVGFDVDSRKVDAINAGTSYIKDAPSERLDCLVSEGLLKATTDFDQLSKIDCVSVCVPTPLGKTKEPDMSFILNAADQISTRLHRDMLIVLESTTYPGTTEEVFLPRLKKNGYKVGKDIFVAFSPERVDPGNPQYQTRNTPKVIGGLTAECTRVAAALYSHAVDRVVPVSSATVAEMVKLLENTFRMINIGMVNEMAIMCDRLGVNVWEVIDAAATKPFGFMKFTPGPGLGGHCIPIDPLYLSWKLKSLNYNARFIELASEINANMPRYVVSKVQDGLNQQRKALNGSRVLVLGVAYKKDIDDLRESPALDVIGLLKAKGAEVLYHDPFISRISHEGLEMESVEDLMATVQAVDCVVCVTDHTAYDYAGILKAARLVVDTRNAFASEEDYPEKIVKI